MVKICKTEDCKKKPRAGCRHCAACIKRRNAESRLKSYHKLKDKNKTKKVVEAKGQYFTPERIKWLAENGYQPRASGDNHEIIA